MKYEDAKKQVPLKRASSDRRAPPRAERSNEDAKQKAQDERIVLLREKLNGSGHFGNSFRKLVAAGCEREWLEMIALHDWHHHPWKRAKNLVGGDERKAITSTARILDREAKKLAPFLPVLVAHLLLSDGVAAEEIHLASVRLRKIAKSLRSALVEGKKRHTIEFVASRQIHYVLSEIRRMTGKPHFKELAQLYATTYERSVGPEDLKSVEAREEARLRKRNEMLSRKRA